MIREPEKIHISAGYAADGDGGIPVLHCISFPAAGRSYNLGGRTCRGTVPARHGHRMETVFCSPWVDGGGPGASVRRRARGRSSLLASPIPLPTALRPHVGQDRLVYPGPKIPGGMVVWFSQRLARKALSSTARVSNLVLEVRELNVQLFAVIFRF